MGRSTRVSDGLGNTGAAKIPKPRRIRGTIRIAEFPYVTRDPWYWWVLDFGYEAVALCPVRDISVQELVRNLWERSEEMELSVFKQVTCATEVVQ